MLCAISGEVPEVPVVSTKTGHIFEKRLILKYIAENGTCPVTGAELAEGDLVEIQQGNPTGRPKIPSMTSIPALLSTFQDEWDAVMLETFKLKQQYQQVRQELAQALYQNDASCRVIARLIKERDAARDALTNIQSQMPGGPVPHGGDAMQVESEAPPADAAPAQAQSTDATEGFTDEIRKIIKDTAGTLCKGRKKRKVPAELTSAADIAQFLNVATVPSMHSSTKPGVTCLAVDRSGELVLTGGEDAVAQVYHIDQGQILAVLKGHNGRINDVTWLGQTEAASQDVILSAGTDKTVRVWHATDAESPEYACIHTIQAHHSEVVALTVHPSRELFVSASRQGSWVLHRASSGAPLAAMQAGEGVAFNCAQFHPDGVILAAGTQAGTIPIWNIKDQTLLATLAGHQGAVTALAFSENGYYLASAGEDYAVYIWDLRSQSQAHVLTLDNESGTAPQALTFDHSGSYLVVAGVDIRIFQVKGWTELAVFDDNAGPVTGIQFVDPLARTLVASSLDRTLRFYAMPS
ncbi:hypothetical protein H4R33_001302 [Dimargaris cristalligena]|uniref:Pre-mRNA-processing factor 19 n=1 Tax=Dimargaris cristalligena TaxID=215637 RepID=A0A4P9ZV77_9FUNG|nr:hypothetical protein H4R33_001302 [Dimargaris cristalligena]RKP37494.1 wd-repeat protein [Dimargaris cristalligena]|eukprot:RKP37494.1 wd-repeat protein [Dimargaris cristalligena]